jgi:hypothetical protein
MKVSSVIRLFGCFGVAAVLTSATTSPVRSQDPNLKSTYGSVKLKSGFLPDPHKVKLTAGGPIETDLGGGGFTQYVAKAPDFKLYYTAGKLPLTIRATSKGDVCLLINTPSGKWVSDDDGDGGLNARITFDEPESGRYDIWVGTFNEGESPQATLFITELK